MSQSRTLSAATVAVTVSGAIRPIVWIGHRSLVCGDSAQELHPIRVAAHAFGPARPARDLLLSPGHPVLVDADVDGERGYLVPIMCLINGTTIRREAVDQNHLLARRARRSRHPARGRLAGRELP